MFRTAIRFCFCVPVLVPLLAVAQSAAPQPEMALRTSANLVLVDVVVTDHGNAVHGIERSRFRVYEDGHERPVTGFDEHQPPVTAPGAAAVAAQIAALPPHTYTNTPLYPDSGVVNVLLLDALNTPMADQAEARRQMIAYLSNIPPGTSLAIFTLASHLQMIGGFTTDAAELAKVMKSKAASPSHSVITEDQANSAQMDDEQMLAMMDPSTASPAVVGEIEQFEEDLTAFQTYQRVQMTLDAMQQLARFLAGIRGRKNLIWFSGSFPITIDPESGGNSSPGRNVQDFGDQIRTTSDLFTAARVAVYPVDARGMLTQKVVDVTYDSSPNGMSVNAKGNLIAAMQGQNIGKDNDTLMTQTLEEQGSMQTLAEETGGKVFLNSNDLKGAVASAVENGSSYYTLAFAPGGKKMDGHYRRIEVKLDGASYNLAYRRGYYADPAAKPSKHNSGIMRPIDAASLHGAPPATEVLFHATVLPATDPAFAALNVNNVLAGEMAKSLKEPRLYVADLTVDAHSLVFSSLPDDVRQAQVEFVLLAFDADGKRVNYVDHSYAINLIPDEFARVMQNGVHGRLALDVPASRCSLRIVVADLEAGRTGSLEVQLAKAN